MRTFLIRIVLMLLMSVGFSHSTFADPTLSPTPGQPTPTWKSSPTPTATSSLSAGLTTVLVVPIKTIVPTTSPDLITENLPIEKGGDLVIQERPWLKDLYSWKQTFNFEKDKLQMNQTGAYCVGNGKTFALLGLSTPLWSWSDIYGASYQEPELGSLHMSVTRAGIPAWTPVQTIGWVKHSGVVTVHAQGKGLVVETYDFAPVNNLDDRWNNPAALVRLVHIINQGSQPETDLDIALKVDSSWNVTIHPQEEGNDLIFQQKPTPVKVRTFWRLGSFDEHNIRIWDETLHYSVPTLNPGQETWAAFFLTAADSYDANKELTEEIRQKGALRLLDDTYDYFKNWFAQGTIFSGDPHIVDLFDIESTIFKCEESSTGGFSPLIGYSYTWIRDNNGPIRWFLKTGHPTEAKRAIDFFYGVAATMGSLPNSIRVDYPLDYHLKDLSHIHVEHAETPNWIVLQHWWYYLTTGDLDFVQSHWPYLMRCITGQVNVHDQYFFHRDETYLWCLESRCFDETPFPNYDLSTYAFSADSSFDLVSAADHLAYMGKFMEKDEDVAQLKSLADRVRAKTEAVYWDDAAGYWIPAESLLGPLYNAPFANILLNPLWCGYARNDLDPLGPTPLAFQKAVLSFKNAYPILGRKDGFWKTTPTMSFFVGMDPGQMLYDFCIAHLAWVGKAYQAVLRAATPSGEFAEMYDKNFHPWNPPVWGIGASGRVRPWEGGLDTESILEYLIGFEPDAGDNRVVFSPHMPLDQARLSADHLMVGQASISIDMRRDSPEEWNCTFHLDHGQPLEVIADFWADHDFMNQVSAVGSVNWDKTLKETQYKEACCHFTLDSSKNVTFVISDGTSLPPDELTPPKPENFQPAPFLTASSNVLLLTSPTAVLHYHKVTQADHFLNVGRRELRLLLKVTPSLSFLDMDLPIAPTDIAKALLTDQNNPKVKLAVLGRGAFCPGKHDFKPVSFWADPVIGKAVAQFIKKGGIFFIGPSYEDREVLPNWMVSLSRGGWTESTVSDRVLLASQTPSFTQQTLCDEVNVDNAQSEENHSVTWKGATFADTQKLPNSISSQKLVEDSGRGFTDYYQFTLKTSPGLNHRLWVRVNTGRNIVGMALMVNLDNQWVQLGTRTQEGKPVSCFESLIFDVPAKYIQSPQTVFRLVSKNGREINAYHLWMYQLGTTAELQTLPEILSLNSVENFNPIGHGLIPKSVRWECPLILSKNPNQDALMIMNIGKGYLIRSELSIEDSLEIFRALLNADTRENLDRFFGVPDENNINKDTKVKAI